MAVSTPTPDWLQRLRPASFRGVPFHVDSIDSRFGRRTVTHEYPQRNKPFSEDLGRRARRFNVTAYLVGGSYHLARDRLIAACETEGPGELVHPYQGTIQVVLEDDAVVCERRQDGGYCEISMPLVEAGENEFPSAIQNPSTAVGEVADDSQDIIADVMGSKYDIENLPEFVRTEMKDAARALLGPVDRLLSASNSFSEALTAFKTGIDSLIMQPRALADGFLGVIRNITGLVGANRSTRATLHEMAANALRLVPETTGTRRRQSRAQTAMQAAVQQMAAAEQARVVVAESYESYQEAQAARDQAVEDIDLVSETADDEVFDTLQKLRAKVVQALPNPKLPEIQTVTLRQATPSLVLAYQIYGDSLREADIAARNRVRHPGFIPGGASVEVVVDG